MFRRSMTGYIVVAVTLVVGLLIGIGLRRRSGVLATGGGGAVTGEDLGVELGERATLVQFSTAFCAPCRATRRVLSEVAAMVPGVRHVEIDAESRLDLVRRFDIMRTPTVLVLDTAGRIIKRAAGAPRRVDVIAALGLAVDDSSGQQ